MGGRLTSKERTQARGRVLPQDVGRGPRGQATPPERRQGLEAQSLPRRGGESLRVSQPEGRGNSACVPASRPSGNKAGETPQGVGRRAAKINPGYRRGVINRRGAGEGVGGGPQKGWGRRSVCLLRGRPEVWGWQGSGSASSRRRLQAALSPPPGACSPVRSRARAARWEGRRRREQPVV